MTKDDLIRALEAATGPDTALAFSIAFHEGWTRNDRGHWVRPDGSEMAAGHWPPNYTGSVNAACTLVTEGHFWEVSGPRRYLGIPTPVPNYWCANLTIFDGRHMTFGGWGATEALARCIAALRARP